MSSAPFMPIRLTPPDADRYIRLRRRMLTAAPWAFSASPEDDEALELDYVARMFVEEQNATFAVEARNRSGVDSAGSGELRRPAELIAAASITRAKQPKFAHRARIWGVFVEPAFRGQGLGRVVLRAAIDLGRSWSGVDYIDLGVSENSPEAYRLYESFGFQPWGREPETTQHEGERYDEIFMTLRL